MPAAQDAQAMRAGFNYVCISKTNRHYCDTQEQAKRFVKLNGGSYFELCREDYE